MNSRGFSLIELMIVVGIIAIVTAIGYPAYQSVMASGYRSTAQADLMGLASAMERHYSAQFSYEGAASGGSDTGSPAIFAAYSPSTEGVSNKRYDLTIVSVSNNGSAFEIRAVPVSGSGVETDGTLFYFSDGRKGWDQNNDGALAASEYCWSC